MQKNWIGKSFGCEVDFKIEGDLPVKNIKCFTTRPDTLFGFSFLLYLLIILCLNILRKFRIENFKECSKTGTTEESIAQAEKIGFKTNLQAINLMTEKSKSCIFANFVYGLRFWCSFWMPST